MQNGNTTLENSMAASSKVKYLPCGPAIPLQGIYLGEIKA
jgi:hypothetical protein